MGPLVFIPSVQIDFGSPFHIEGYSLSLDMGEGLGPAPNHRTDFEDSPMEGLTLPGEQKGDGIGNRWGAGDEVMGMKLGLTRKTSLFLI